MLRKVRVRSGRDLGKRSEKVYFSSGAFIGGTVEATLIRNQRIGRVDNCNADPASMAQLGEEVPQG